MLDLLYSTLCELENKSLYTLVSRYGKEIQAQFYIREGVTNGARVLFS